MLRLRVPRLSTIALPLDRTGGLSLSQPPIETFWICLCEPPKLSNAGYAYGAYKRQTASEKRRCDTL